jgi:hypothetical protein
VDSPGEAANQKPGFSNKPGFSPEPGVSYEQAAQRQLEAIVALRHARERFLDLRGLIEMAYSRQRQVQALLPPAAVKDAKDDAETPAFPKSGASPRQDEDQQPPQVPAVESLQAAHQLQQENLDRSQRIGRLIDEGLAALPKPAAGPENPTAKPKPNDPAAQQTAQRQQLDLAKQLLGQARQEMTAAAESLSKAGATDAKPATAADGEAKQSDLAGKPQDQPPDDAAAKPDDAAMTATRGHVSQALEHLQALRRLFFSIVEHLRETAQRQAQLNDETEQVAALKDDAKDDAAGRLFQETRASKVGPLALRQQQLRGIAKEIADALSEQAQQQPVGAASQQGADPQQQEQLQKATQQLAEAARLVADGGTEMQQAGDGLSAEKPDLGAARKHQDEALKKLVEALALLNPPHQDQQDQQDQQNQDQQGQGHQAGQQPQDQQGADPSRALQAVRDREAQRRHDRENRQRLAQEPVEKDW